MTVDLTQQMIDDFCKHIKPKYVELFISSVRKDEKHFGGPVTRIEDVPFPDGTSGIMEKRYYFADEPDPIWILDVYHCGVDSL